MNKRDEDYINDDEEQTSPFTSSPEDEVQFIEVSSPSVLVSAERRHFTSSPEDEVQFIEVSSPSVLVSAERRHFTSSPEDEVQFIEVSSPSVLVSAKRRYTNGERYSCITSSASGDEVQCMNVVTPSFHDNEGRAKRRRSEQIDNDYIFALNLQSGAMEERDSHNSIENVQTSAECITLNYVNNNKMDDRLPSLHESLVKYIMMHKQQIQSKIKESVAISGAQQYHLLLEKIAILMQTGTLRFDPNDLLLKSDEREITVRVVKRALGILKDEAATVNLMSWLATDPDLNITTWFYGSAKEVLMSIECMDWTDKHKF